LNQKEQQCDDYPNPSPCEESLNEEALNDEDDVKQDKYYKWYVEFDIRKGS
jgi:hypothetical protein